jgi:hypothetical protein
MGMNPIAFECSEEELISHLEASHSNNGEVLLLFKKHRRLANRSTWEHYHDYWLHRDSPYKPDHEHERYIWSGWESGSMVDRGWTQSTRCVCLQPPRHQPDCPGRMGVLVLGDRHGPSAREVIWEKLDSLMDGLKAINHADMAGARAEAGAYAFALAVMMNPSEPDVDAIRKEAMRRWKERSNA